MNGGLLLFTANVIKLSKTCQRISAINQSYIGMVWGYCHRSEAFKWIFSAMKNFGYSKQTDCISALKHGILLAAVALYTKR